MPDANAIPLIDLGPYLAGEPGALDHAAAEVDQISLIRSQATGSSGGFCSLMPPGPHALASRARRDFFACRIGRAR